MSDGYELTDAEKRDLIKLINEGKPLPDKYRFVLFQDKREVELVWNGKTREVTTAVLPFQTLEHIDEPREEIGEREAAGLFDIRGRQLKGWTNKLIWGDNKLILSSLKSGALRRQIEDAGGLKLITSTRRSTSAPTSAWTSTSATRPFIRNRISSSRSPTGTRGGGALTHSSPWSTSA